MKPAARPPPALTWTLRLLAGACLFGAWNYVALGIRIQSPDDYWLGIAFAAEALGLLRRVHWARACGLFALAFAAAWIFWEQTRSTPTVGSALAAGATLLAAWFLARHPQHFVRSWW